MERLRQEALDLAGARHDQLISFAQFIHAQNGDDVLQALVLLQHFLNRTGDSVMLFTHHARGEHAAGRIERIDGRVDAHFRDRAAQHGGGIQVGERRGRGRIGQIVGGHVNGLHRGDRTLVGGGDALLQGPHVGGERRLIAHGRRDTAE